MVHPTRGRLTVGAFGETRLRYGDVPGRASLPITIVAAIALLAAATTAHATPRSSHGATKLVAADKKPPQCRAPVKWRRLGRNYAGAFRVSCIICSVFTVAQVAKEYHSKRDPISAALALSKADHPYEQASFSGCLRGFKVQGVL